MAQPIMSYDMDPAAKQIINSIEYDAPAPVTNDEINRVCAHRVGGSDRDRTTTLACNTSASATATSTAACRSCMEVSHSGICAHAS